MKRIAVATVTVVAILALLVAALPFVIPGGFLRDVVAAKITTWTGRAVAVAGEPSLSVYPELAITVADLTVSNPEDMGDEAFVAAEGVRASLRALPLLIGRVEFNEFELIRPRFRLIVGKDGTTNWRMGESAIAAQAIRDAESAPEAGAAAAADTETLPAGPPTPVPEDIRIGRVRVTDGIILYDDLAAEAREEITDLEIQVHWPTASTPAQGFGSFMWRGEEVKFNGALADPLDLIAGGDSPVRFAVAATRLRGSFAGEASSAGPMRLDGDATITTPSLRRTIEWLGTPTGVGAILGAGSIAGAASWSGRSVTFDAATVELDGNRADGSLAIVFGGARPAVQGTLAAERLDLTPYLEAVRADITAEGPWPIAPTRLPFAGAADVDVRFTAGQVQAGAARIGKLAGTLRMDDGTVEVAIDDGQVYGGSLAGRVRAGMIEGELVASVEAEAAGVPAGVALADLAGVGGLDGTAAATLGLNGRGKTWGEFARSLAGIATATVTRGTLNGLDVAAIADVMADPLADPLAPSEGTTAFSSLAATLSISGGILSTEDLTLRGAGFSVTLTGTGSLLTGLVDATARLTAGPIDVPVTITGGWRNPVISRGPIPAAADAPADPAGPTGG